MRALALLLLAALVPACSSGSDDVSPAGPTCDPGGTSTTKIRHVVIVMQENHTFDNYFGSYCTAPPGSAPSCNEGPSCCEAAPATEPKGHPPVVLDDASNAQFDPDHTSACEDAEVNGGKMDGFVEGPKCASPKNFAVAPAAAVSTYRELAAKYALADRYFQPITGQSTANDMYFAVARFEFADNEFAPQGAPGLACDLIPKTVLYEGKTTIADVLQKGGKTVGYYAEGWNAARAADPKCAPPPDDCQLRLPLSPCSMTPADIPFLYYAQHAKDPALVRDHADFAKDVAAGRLPNVAWVKPSGYHSEHPGFGTDLASGMAFVSGVVKAVQDSCHANDTLVLITWDEGGGYFDHVAPPSPSAVDGKPYGTRVPLLAVGPFARKGHVSHVTMEHSSIVRFLEQNFLGTSGQLGARDATVAGIASLLDPAAVGAALPD